MKLILALTLAATGALADTQRYTVAFQPNEHGVSCRPDYDGFGSNQKTLLFVSFPAKAVQAKFHIHSLRAEFDSDLACQRQRLRIIDQGPFEAELERKSETRQQTDMVRKCRYVGGGGHAGPRPICHNYPVERTYLHEEISGEILGVKLVSTFYAPVDKSPTSR